MKFQLLSALALFSGLVAATDGACHGAYISELIPAPLSCTRKTRTNDTVTLDYKGYFPNGTVFDQSYGSPDGPFTFQYNVGQVIKGFDQGLDRMCVGEKRWVMIPPKWGYGVKGTSDGVIPPNSTIIFEILLEDIKAPVKSGRQERFRKRTDNYLFEVNTV